MENQKKVWNIVGRGSTVLFAFLWPYSLIPIPAIWPLSLLPSPTEWASDQVHARFSSNEILTMIIALWGFSFCGMILGDPAKYFENKLSREQLFLLRKGPHLILSRALAGLGTMCSLLFALSPWMRPTDLSSYPVMLLGWIAVLILASQTQAILFWIRWQRQFLKVHAVVLSTLLLSHFALSKLLANSLSSIVIVLLCVTYAVACMWIFQTFFRTPDGPPENPWKVILPSLFDRKSAE